MVTYKINRLLLTIYNIQKPTAPLKYGTAISVARDTRIYRGGSKNKPNKMNYRTNK